MTGRRGSVAEFRERSDPGAGGAPDQPLVATLERIAAALERISPPPAPAPDWSAAEAWAWAVDPDRLIPIADVNRVEMGLLLGINRARDTLLENTRRF